MNESLWTWGQGALKYFHLLFLSSLGMHETICTMDVGWKLEPDWIGALCIWMSWFEEYWNGVWVGVGDGGGDLFSWTRVNLYCDCIFHRVKFIEIFN